MKKMITLTACVTLAFVAGWFSSRSYVLKQYPPETVDYLTELRKYLSPMTKEEMAYTVLIMQQNMDMINTEFDYQVLYEGTSARWFELALDKGGEPEARKLVERQFHKFQERYDRGLRLPEGAMNLAASLSESIKDD